MPMIGISCDNYKISKFKKELTKANIPYTTLPLTADTTMFMCDSEQHIVKPVVDKVTQYFINKYKRNN